MQTPIKIDLKRCISMNIKALDIFQVGFYLPYSKTSYKFWLTVIFRGVMGFFFFFIPPIVQFMYVVKILKSDNPQIQEVASVINLVFTESLTSLKLLDLFLRRDVLTKLTNQLNSEEFRCFDKNHQKIIERGISLSRRFFIGMLALAGTDVGVHMLVMPSVRRFEQLPVKMDMVFFDVNDPAYFPYVCFYQILYKPSVVVTYVGCHSMVWAFMYCTICQLDVLINKLENMKELVKITKAEKSCDENEAFRIIFKNCVLHHDAILRFSKSVQATFGGQLTMTLFISSFIIGTTAVQIFSIESPRKNISEVIFVIGYLSVFIGNLFIDSYLGNSITYRSLRIPTLIFSGPWLNLPTKTKRNLVIFIAKTQQPIFLTAASLIPISMETFTRIMNWTYKGFAVMNQMKKLRKNKSNV